MVASPDHGTPEELLAWLTSYGLDACDLDNRAEVRTIHRNAARVVPQAAIVLAVGAALARVDGDIPQAIRGYRNALEANPEAKERAAILEDLISLEGARHELETSATDTPLAIALADHPEHIGLRSVRAIMRAVRGDPSAGDDIEDVVDQSTTLADVPRARVLQRASVAAYYVRDYGLSQRLALEAVAIAQRANANRIAARAFLQLYIIALGVTCDHNLALFYATEAGVAASIAEDRNLRQLMLGAEYALEAAAGRQLRVQDLREQIRRVAQHSAYYDKFGIQVADALWYGWNHKWDSAKATLLAMRVTHEEPGYMALQSGLLALVEIALGDRSHAVRSAAVAVAWSRSRPGDAGHVSRTRNLGRVLSAAAFVFSGKVARGSRLLLAREFTEGAPASVRALAGTIENGRFSDLRDDDSDVYGYGLFLAAVRRQIYDPEHGPRLTRREIELLTLRAQGVSVAEIAKQQSVSYATVMKRQQSAVEKLDCPNVLAAISEARRRGLLA